MSSATQLESKKRARMPIEQLRQQTCYKNLTDKQRKLVETYISSNGDRAASVLAAYDVRDANVAKKYSYEALAAPAVVECLTVYFQNDPREDFKKQVQRALKSGRLTTAEIRAMELLAKLNGWHSDSLPSRNGYIPVSQYSKKCKVGDIIVIDGQRIRVNEVNEDDRPVDGDPL